MNYIHIIALLALLQYGFFGIMVGYARGKYGIHAPATSGNEHFERAFRIHANTLEQLVIFLPTLFIAGAYWPNAVIALIGLVYLCGRFIYWRAYTKNPQTRAIGFLLTAVSNIILIIAGLTGVFFNS
ncbi:MULTISPECIES: MAPEG family protein [unclassified Neisseria]|uniref:MAPEG family protein n=1 Tax=unclassified Neisseria TaxID=2623750 RepID=UPI002665EC4C|nr:MULTISPECIES: MAPEG family protein [unclassified Neisseria]MDO1510069.1 MAPEG family protein [Neisseria sp. MVDL19-042950]MDO1516901.1 MAPEG family protein [Neisseria sp. MVDL18-041461]MDO1564186.1 MAPEG family protein [Neisseria sp. MVDL20-010259]